MRTRKFHALCLSLALVACFTVRGLNAQKDEEGCKDSPLISRFPGSVITSCDVKDDNAFKFTVTTGGKDVQKELEGKYFYARYQFPSTASKAQVVRNYTTAMRNAGWLNDYDSGSYGDSTWHKGGTWIMIEISQSGAIDIHIVTLTQLTQDVVASAAQLSGGIDQTGHAVVPGILFDTGKAELKPESAAALAEVAKLLGEHAGWKLYVVGHTDNVGQLVSNVTLSQKRAEAVVQALVAQYKVAAGRLQAFGDGPYAPVASNDSEEGRSQNRRVEIVKQ